MLEPEIPEEHLEEERISVPRRIGAIPGGQRRRLDITETNEQLRRVQSATDFKNLPRRVRTQVELAAIGERLRDMQLEVSRLNQKVREYEEDSSHWMLRYTRRSVILCNWILGIWSFFVRFAQCIRRRARLSDSMLGRLFEPGGPSSSGSRLSWRSSASSSAAAAAAASAPQQTVASVFLAGFLESVQASSPFFMSVALQMGTAQSWRRNTGFLISVGYSIFQLWSRDPPLPLIHYFNVVVNVLYLLARYYFLHGLLSFSDVQML